jgi:hypothetical protein
MELCLRWARECGDTDHCGYRKGSIPICFWLHDLTCSDSFTGAIRSCDLTTTRLARHLSGKIASMRELVVGSTSMRLVKSPNP